MIIKLTNFKIYEIPVIITFMEPLNYIDIAKLNIIVLFTYIKSINITAMNHVFY